MNYDNILKKDVDKYNKLLITFCICLIYAVVMQGCDEPQPALTLSGIRKSAYVVIYEGLSIGIRKPDAEGWFYCNADTGERAQGYKEEQILRRFTDGGFANDGQK